MQTNSSQWLRRMREKHRRLFWKRGLEDRFQVLPESGKKIHQVLKEDQVQRTGERVEQGQRASTQSNVISLEHRRSVASGSPPPPTLAELEADVWELRKQFILHIANRRNGKVRLQEVAAECNVNIRIAAEWLIRLSTEGMLSLVAGQRNRMTYLVKETGGAQK